jgi:MFS family permease
LPSPPVKPRTDWINATLPFNIATGPIGTFVQLYIINLTSPGLGTIYASLAVTAFNAVSIPAAYIWGAVTDAVQSRRLIILMTFGVTTVLLLSFLLTGSSVGIIAVYSAISFISAADATPLNLLIMETEPKNMWAKSFAHLSMVASIGTTVGSVLCAVWTVALPFRLLVTLLGAFSLLSLALAVLLIHDPPFNFELQVVVINRPSFFQRLLSFPMMFLSRPHASDFKRIFRGVRNELTSPIPLLYISISLFYLASGLFNTSLVPALTAHSLSSSGVFIVSTVALGVQTIAFRYIGPYLEKRSLPVIATSGLVLRGVCYGLMGVVSFLISGPLLVVPTLVLYPLAGGVAYAAYYTSSNTMIFNSLGDRNQGEALGVYSSVVGAFTFLGSLLSGFISYYAGFHTTFLAAAVLLGLAGLATSRLRAEAAGSRNT